MLAAAGVVAVILLAVIGYFSVRVWTELDALRSAPRDNVQWTLAQLEVDVMRLERSIHLVYEGDQDLDEVRLRFDNFYNRAHIVLDGQLFAGMRGLESIQETFDQIRQILNSMVPFIDGNDPYLRANLPLLEVRLDGVVPAIRTIAIEGVAYYSDVSDQQRERFTNVLGITAYTAAGLIGALGVALVVLVAQFRISARRSEELAAHQQRFAATFNTAMDAILVMDANGDLVDCNAAAEDLFGFRRATALGREMAALIIPERLRQAHRSALHRYLVHGEKSVLDSRRLEVTATRADGIEFPAELSISVAERRDGPIFIGFVRDISARLQAERAIMVARDKALAADRAKTDFIAVVSHEMRTPLNGLIGLLDLLQQTEGLNQKQRRYLETALNSGELLLRQINNVLDMTRVETGNIELAEEPVDLPQLIASAVAMNQPIAAARGTVITAAPCPAPLAIAGDPHLTQQVLLNLIGNAAKFTTNGKIDVATRIVTQSHGRTVVEVSVEDTGIGIPKADHKRIFDDFTMLDTSYHRATSGSGLGLAICRRIVEAMGGTIGVESAPGVGSRFWFRIPFLNRAAVPDDPRNDAYPRPPEPAAAGSVERLRVLVVDDNDINRIVAGEMLRNMGHDVTEAGDGQTAINLAANQRFDLILMDISMPGIDGIEAAKRIRSGQGRSRNALIAAQTAHAAPEEQERFRAAGIQYCLIKPFRSDDVEALLAGAMADAASNRAAPPPVPAGPQGEPESGAESGAEAASSSARAALNDAKVAELRVVMGHAGAESALRRLAEQITETLPDIAAASRAGDHGAAARLGHKLAGSAAVLGAEQLHGALKALETAYRQGPAAIADNPGLLPAVETAARHTITAIDATLGENAPQDQTAPVA